jgi:hypothetical protein
MAKSFLITRKRSLLQRLGIGSRPRRPEVTDALIAEWCQQIEARHPLFDSSVPASHPVVGANDVGDRGQEAASSPVEMLVPAVHANHG